MAFDYSELLAVSKELVDEFGRTMQFRTLDNTPDDSAKPWLGNDEARSEGNSFNAIAVNLPASGGGMGFVTNESDLLRMSSAMIILAPVDGQDPMLVEEVIDQGCAMRVTMIERLQPGDTILLYIIGVKQ